MRGISVPWMIFYAIGIIFIVAFLPGIITSNNQGLAAFDNKSDPGYLAMALFPLIIFSIFLFKPWNNTEAG
jgi:hypothetical protein